MTEGSHAPIDETLQHELNNAMMIVLSSAQVIDRCAGSDPRVHDAVSRIQHAVDRSKHTVEDLSRELAAVASRLSARRL